MLSEMRLILIRPTSDLLCADEELHLATFLAMHYYQTYVPNPPFSTLCSVIKNRVITVHQAALMVDTETYQSKIAQHCRDSPWRARLRSSESILLNSARKIANLQIDLTDRRVNSKLITVTQVMLAMMVIALNITKTPESRRNRLDAEVSVGETPKTILLIDFISYLRPSHYMPRMST